MPYNNVHVAGLLHLRTVPASRAADSARALAVHLLEQVAASGPDWLTQCVADAPADSLLTDVCLGRPDLVLSALTNPKLTAAQLQLVLDRRPLAKVRAAVASHPSLTDAQAIRLAKSPAKDTVVALLARPRLPASVVDGLVAAADAMVAKGPFNSPLTGLIRQHVSQHVWALSADTFLALSSPELVATVAAELLERVPVTTVNALTVLNKLQPVLARPYQTWTFANIARTVRDLLHEFPVPPEVATKLTEITWVKRNLDVLQLASAEVVQAHQVLDRVEGDDLPPQWLSLVDIAVGHHARLLARKLLARRALPFAAAFKLALLFSCGELLSEPATAAHALAMLAVGHPDGAEMLGRYSAETLSDAFEGFHRLLDAAGLDRHARTSAVHDVLLSLSVVGKLSVELAGRLDLNAMGELDGFSVGTARYRSLGGTLAVLGAFLARGGYDLDRWSSMSHLCGSAASADELAELVASILA